MRKAASVALLLAAAVSGVLAQAVPEPGEQKPSPSPKALVESMAEDNFAGLRVSRELAALGAAALPALVQGTRHEAPRVRYWCIATLSRLGGDTAAVAIMPLLNDPDPVVRSVAVWHLGGWLDRADVRSAVLAKVEDEDPSVRGWALRVIQTRRCTEALPAVRKLLASSEPETRYDALHTIALLRGPEALDDLRQALLTDASPLVRECALRCTTVVEPRTARVGELLILGLQDGEAAVRETAIKLLRKGFGQRFGFDPSGEAEQRQKAVQQWTAWYAANGPALRWSDQRQRFERPEAAMAPPAPPAPARGRSD